MSLVECAWHKIYTIGTRVFLLFVAISLPLLFLGRYLIKEEPNWGYLLAFILLANGVVWLLIGLFGLIKNRVIANRISQLKNDGDQYTATIKQMLPLSFISLGAHVFASAIGHFTDSFGNDQSFRSTTYTFTTFDKLDDFEAKVYVDMNDPQTYAVELFRK